MPCPDAQDAAGPIPEANEKVVTMAIDESDRWFSVERERRREMHKRAERAQRRAARSAAREETPQGAFSRSTTPNINMRFTEWEYDELANLCRKIYAE
jgi:hypothetical protein